MRGSEGPLFYWITDASSDTNSSPSSRNSTVFPIKSISFTIDAYLRIDFIYIYNIIFSILRYQIISVCTQGYSNWHGCWCPSWSCAWSQWGYMPFWILLRSMPRNGKHAILCRPISHLIEFRSSVLWTTMGPFTTFENSSHPFQIS